MDIISSYLVKEPVPQAVPFGMGEQRYVEWAVWAARSRRFLMDVDEVFDEELVCAAHCLWVHRDYLLAARSRLYRTLTERMQGLTEVLG